MTDAHPARTRRRAFTGVVAVATVAALVTGYLVMTSKPATAKQFATLHVLEGTVEVGTGSGAFRTGAEGDTLREGNVVRTAADSRASIEYFDGSLTMLDERTEFTLQELSADPQVPGSKQIAGAQTAGRTLNRVIELTDSQSRFDVETPSAVASVAGTEYVVIVYPDGSSEYWVLEGSVILLFPDGSTLRLEAGQGVRVDASGIPGDIFEVSLDDEATLCVFDERFCVEDEEPRDRVLGVTVTRSSVDDGGSGGGEGTSGPGDELIPPLVIVRQPPKTTDPEPDPPEIVEGPDQEGSTDSRSATFVFRSNDDTDTFECQLDDGPWEPCTSGTTYSVRNGTHTFRVRAKNANGQTGPATVWTWTVDAPPTTRFVSTPPLISDSSTATFEVETDEVGVTFACALDDGGLAPCPIVPGGISILSTALPTTTIEYTGLTDGSHTLTVLGTTSTGKQEIDGASYTWTVEAADPETTLDDASIDRRSASFTFSSNENGTFECRLDRGATEGTWETCTSGQGYTDLPDGAYTFNVRARDLAGNHDPSPATHSWTVSEDGSTDPDPTSVTVTLTWTGGPQDLDLRVFAPSASGDENALPTTGGSRSETVTIEPPAGGFPTGAYRIMVVNASCEVGYAGSGATVTITGGHSFSAPSETGKMWRVATFGIGTDGTVGSVSAIGRVDGAACERRARGPRLASLSSLQLSSVEETEEGPTDPPPTEDPSEGSDELDPPLKKDDEEPAVIEPTSTDPPDGE